MSDDKNLQILLIDQKLDDLSQDIKDIKQTQIGHAIQFARHEESDKQMADDIHVIRKTLEKNTESLEEHMRRTAAAEQQILSLKDISVKMDSRLSPIEEERIEKETLHRLYKKAGTYFGVISAVVTTAYTVWLFIKGV